MAGVTAQSNDWPGTDLFPDRSADRHRPQKRQALAAVVTSRPGAKNHPGSRTDILDFAEYSSATFHLACTVRDGLYFCAMSNVSLEKCPVCSGGSLNPFLVVKDHSVSGESFKLVKCAGCSLVMTQSHPDQSSIGPYYASEDYISHSNTSKGLVNRLYHLVRKYMLGKKRQVVESYHQSGKLLDIGAGTGYFAAHMRDAGWQVTGLEPDSGARKVAAEQLNLTLQPIEKLDHIAQDTFDAVTMWHVLEHVHALNDNMVRIKSILKDDGLLVIAVPNYTSRDAGKYGEYWAAYDVPRHLWHFSPEAMRHLLDRHGFRLSGLKSMPFDPFYVSLLSEKYKNSALGLVRGGMAGFLSNLRAMGNKDRASSVIYIARKSNVHKQTA